MDDAGFLAAIRAAPDDPAPRLVYADWLDDRGDPRAALIRAEEAMRALAPYSDEYWHLKPERDRLRAFAPRDWLGVLGYDLPWPVFAHGWPDDWKGRWRVLRAYMTNWGGLPMADVGGGGCSVEDVQDAVGHRLPPSLREFVAFDAAMTAGHRRWTRPGWDDGFAARLPAFALHGFDNEDTSHVVMFSAFAEADPPVTLFEGRIDAPAGEDGTLPGCPPYLRSVSDFALALTMACPLPGVSELRTRIDHRIIVDEILATFGGRPSADVTVPLERPGLLVRVRPIGDQQFPAWDVELKIDPSAEASIPGWAWALCGQRDSRCTGVFRAEHERFLAENPPAGDDDMPF